MTNILVRACNWFRRFRHRRGYGVHSPSDFFLITFVIYEQWPFYAYSSLHKLRNRVEHLPHYREKVDKLLLRLVNHLQPSHLFEIGTGSGLSSQYMAAGNAKMAVASWDSSLAAEVNQLIPENRSIGYYEGGVDEACRAWQEQAPAKVMVHIAHTPLYKEAFESLVPMADSQTCFVIGSPYADEDKKLWWKEVVADPRTGVTFDLYDIGLVFFDKQRVKEHRVVNFL